MKIARIKLAQGQCGFYDAVSGIHLTLTTTEADVTKGTNTVGLINAVACGKIVVIEGNLGEDTHGISKEQAIHSVPTYYRLLEKKQKSTLKERLVRDLTQVEAFVEKGIDKIEEVLMSAIDSVAVKETVIVEAPKEVIVEAPKKAIKKTVKKVAPVVETKTAKVETVTPAKVEIKPTMPEVVPAVNKVEEAK